MRSRGSILSLGIAAALSQAATFGQHWAGIVARAALAVGTGGWNARAAGRFVSERGPRMGKRYDVPHGGGAREVARRRRQIARGIINPALAHPVHEVAQ